MKKDIVGGHINLFNMGLLIYRLIIAGFDCKNACGLSYGYNVTVIVKKINIDNLDLSFDSGDIKKIKRYFPSDIQGLIDDGDHFHGDINEINWFPKDI